MITTNSLGRPIATTEAGLRAFWKWFGASEAVDEQGRPLVVYHGTHHAKFDRFDPARIGETDAGWYGRGFYFSATEKEARHYGPNVIPAYLRIENPARFGGVVSDGLVAMAEQHHDGVIVTERPGDPPLELVVWRPTQIKSAAGNRGTFDPADPVITNPRRNPPIPYEPPTLAGMRVLKGFRPAAQRHEHTCGPDCLRAVLHYFGRRADEHLLAEACGTTKASGTTPEGMIGALVQLHYRATIKRSASVAWCIAQLKRDRPVMLLWNDWKGHWVVLIGYNPENGNLLLADPANRRTGLRIHTPATLRRNWTARVGGRLYDRVAIAVD